jgi:transcriptional/translational regulatory protein YebC/TACO1
MQPTSTIAVEESDVAKRVLRLIDALDDNDDVQDVYANFDISDELLESIEA